MKLRFTHAKWCFAFIVFTVANFQISMLILRIYNNSEGGNRRNDNELNRQYIPEIPSQYAYNPPKTISKSRPSRQRNLLNTSSRSQRRLNNHKPSLPAFAIDSTEFVFGSLIERGFDSWDLHITTFLLCHYMLEPDSKNGVEKVHPATQDKWKRAIINFRGVNYLKNGQRKDEPVHYCRIRNSPESDPYVVKAFFVPNRLTSDSNANRRLDILRCGMQNSKEAYLTLARSGHDVQVEILREAISIINFTIPWDTRKTGFMLSSPETASKLDGWRGFNHEAYGSDASKAFETKADDVHICMPGTKRFPSKDVIPLFLEFISHHSLVGAGHIYFPVSVGWKSTHMDRFLQLFRSYIDEEKLSVISHSGDGLDMVHSVAGLTWNRLMIKVMQVNMCLYESKGVADYLLVLDIDEFFIPRPGFNTIGDVIRAVDTRDPLPEHSPNVILEDMAVTWAGGKGWADGEAHPLCFLALESEVIANEKAFTVADPLHPWIGERYKHGTEPKSSGLTKRFAYTKAILPTRVIFQGGLNMGGACMLDRRWTDCKASEAQKEFCGNPGDVRRLGLKSDGKFMDFRKDHQFYEAVLDKDRKDIDSKTQAVVLHYLLHHPDVQASANAYLNTSTYSTLFFDNVMADLRSRHLHLVMLIPDSFNTPATIEDQWSNLFTPEIVNNFAAWQEANLITGSLTKVNDVLLTNYSDRASQHFVELPNFAVDLTDYALSGMIERVSDSYDLWVSTFFICHWLLEPKEGGSAMSGEKMSPEVHDVWKKAMLHFEKTRYLENGEREQPPNYYCKITHAAGYEPYVVSGRFVPNKLTPDSNSNRRTDIFRCKMKNTEQAYMQLARSDEVMEVEILRGDVSVLAYRIPWKTRTAGFMLEFPPEASLFDPWKGFDKSKPGVWKYDNLYMCVPGLETPPSKTSLPLYLEFIQHHLLLGVDHMFIGALFNWESVHMKRLLRILKSYIAANELSVVSTSGDGFDGIYSTAGLVWARDNVKNFHVNMCTYYAKGTADYVGVWDFDEHFIPFGENKNIIDVIRSKESPVPIPYIHPLDARPEDVMPHWRSGRGLADNDGHPFCYLILNSVATLHAERLSTYDMQHPWIGERFSHGAEATHGLAFKKSIRPTRTIFQGGLHLAGACRLPYPYNGCDSDVDFCWSDGWEKGEQYRLTKFRNGSAINFNLNHRFDEILLDQDAKLVDQKTEAVINHIQYHRFWFQSSPEALATKNEYTVRFFPTVMSILADKGLELPVTLPEIGSKPFPEADYDWIELAELRESVVASSIKSSFRLGFGNAAAGSTATFSTILPQWATDKTEVILGSMIERVSDSWDLFLTTFMLCHNMIEVDPNGYSGLKVRQEAQETWREAIPKLQEADYTLAGGRTRPTKFTCRIRHSESSAEYTVPGEWVPNRLTPDMNANRRVDILRCKLENSQQAYMAFARSNTESVHVQIFRDSTFLISFKVPWDSRVNGKTLSTPPASSATSFDVWKGFNKSAPGVWTHDKIYMCVPGIDSSPSKKGLPIFLEFVQHHLLIGVQHMFLTLTYDWESIHMQRYLRVLRSYIDEGSVSVTSHSTEGFDFIYTMLGSSWHREFFKILQLNMCVYLAKGTADYVGVWDVDEFFIPKGKSNTIVEVLDAVSPPNSDTPTFASGEDHPFCYIQLHSQVVANQAPKSDIDLGHPWIGERFGHGAEQIGTRGHNQFSFKKSIIPTRRMFQMGLHMSGGCRLEAPWSGCEAGTDLCFARIDPRRDFSGDAKDKSPRSNHRFDEVVYDADTRKMDHLNEGTIYHFLFYRYYHAIANESVLHEKNDYAVRFFNRTLAELTARNLDLLLTLPEDVLPLARADQAWTQYEVVWESRNTLGTLFPGGELQGINPD